MPEPAEPAAAALDALGFALYVQDAAGALRLAGPPPAWLAGLWPRSAVAGSALPVGDASPFLENFLVDADACWGAGEGRVRSGPWVERDAAGAEVSLEATALHAGGRPLLLLERLGEVFAAKKIVLQKARENVLAYQRLNAEMQKKEILLHCVAEDMTAALANAITALRLIELEQDPAKTRVLLGLASRALEEQQSLIHKVLEVFADDLEGFHGHPGETSAGADLRAVVRAALEEFSPQLAERGVGLRAPDFAGGELRIAVEAAHLQRIVANLLVNAGHTTPAGAEIGVRFEDDLESATLWVEDDGAPVEEDIFTQLFARIGPAEARPEPPLLRLHFCRIAVENCGGEIGCALREGGGNGFWIRLPKARPAS